MTSPNFGFSSWSVSQCLLHLMRCGILRQYLGWTAGTRCCFAPFKSIPVEKYDGKPWMNGNMLGVTASGVLVSFGKKPLI